MCDVGIHADNMLPDAKRLTISVLLAIEESRMIARRLKVGEALERRLKIERERGEKGKVQRF